MSIHDIQLNIFRGLPFTKQKDLDRITSKEEKVIERVPSSSSEETNIFRYT